MEGSSSSNPRGINKGRELEAPLPETSLVTCLELHSVCAPPPHPGFTLQGFLCGLCVSQHRSLRVTRPYLAAQGCKGVPRDRMWNLPVSSGLSPETTIVSLLQYFFGQISHRACPYSRRGDIELIL